MMTGAPYKNYLQFFKPLANLSKEDFLKASTELCSVKAMKKDSKYASDSATIFLKEKNF